MHLATCSRRAQIFGNSSSTSGSGQTSRRSPARAVLVGFDWAPVPNQGKIGQHRATNHACSLGRSSLQIRTIGPAAGAPRNPPDRASHARGRRFETRRAHPPEALQPRGFRHSRGLQRKCSRGLLSRVEADLGDVSCAADRSLAGRRT